MAENTGEDGRELVRYDARDRVAWITVANPPVNALIQPVRAAIDECLARAIADTGIGAIVIAGGGRTFPAGTDVRDVHRAADRPALSELCARIEAAPKPVIAAIHGTALGGGLELALACHVRLARSGSQLGLPDVMLGLVPNAGGTLRLPRLVGAALALEMLLRGHPVQAKPAAKAGLIDRMIRKDFAETVQATADNLARAGQMPRPTSARTDGFANPKAYLEVVAARRVSLARDGRIAPHRLVSLVESALLLPFEQGLAMEHAVYEDLVDSAQARALRHIFLAERRAGRPSGAERASPRALSGIALLGHGDRAAGVARACLAGPMPVLAVDEDEANRLSLRARVVVGLTAEVQAGAITAAEQEAMLDRLDLTGALAGFENGMVIAAADSADTQRAAIARAARETPPGTVVAVLAAPGNLADNEAATSRAGDILGLYLPRPVRRSRLMELSAPNDAAAPELLATGAAFARAVGRIPVVVAGANAGTLTATLDGALFAAAEALTLSGVDFAEIDAALRRAGFPAGPFERADKGLSNRIPPPGADGVLSARIAAAAPRGRYYAGSSAPEDRLDAAPEARDVIAALRRELGLATLTPGPDPDDLVQRCILAMSNAGARLVSAGIVASGADIDIAAVHGLGMPRWLGGPMVAADQFGLLHARNLMRDWAATGDLAHAVWAAAPLFDDLIRTSGHFCTPAG